MFEPGSVVGDKYRIDGVLGQGGMGVLYAATHLELDRKVALKFLLDASAREPSIVERFAREARAAVKIESEHVARVFDVGEAGPGQPFIVMELLDGEPLDALLERQGRLPVATAVDYVLQACEALAEAHTHGIVHRDIKPANLFLARRSGRAVLKVLDFGISKLPIAGAGAALTSKHELIGSPAYMAPEQMLSAASADVRSDVWALGVVLYELLAGAPPFAAETVPQMIARVVHASHRPLTDHRADVPAALVAIIDRCLDKDPSRRFATIGELVRALGPFGPAGSPTLGTADTVHAALLEPRPRRRWWIAGLALAPVAVACGVAAFFLARAERVVEADERVGSEPPPARPGATVAEVAAAFRSFGTVIAESDFAPGAPRLLGVKGPPYAHGSIEDGRFVVEISSTGAHFAFWAHDEPQGDFLLHAKVVVAAPTPDGSALVTWGHDHEWFDLHVMAGGRVVGVLRDASAKTYRRFGGAAKHLPGTSVEHVLDVRHRKEHVSVWLDGVEVIVDVPAPLEPLKLGLGGDQLCRVSFDDVVIARLR